MSGVGTRQRYRRGNPCPVCDGYDEAKRGQGERCYGFLSTDGLYAHCTREDLAGALVQESYGTFPHRLEGPCGCGTEHAPGEEPKADASVAATYDYCSADGTLLYQVIRKIPKKFLQRQPDGRGGWAWNLEGVERVPYRLPQLTAATADETRPLVWIAEGEKCVESLVRLGFVATCNSEGAGKWRSSLNHYFVGFDVVVVADNDPPGLKHADQVAAMLAPVAKSVRIINDLPVKEKGDVVDLVVSMGEEGARDLLLAMAEDTPALEKPPMLSLVSGIAEVVDSSTRRLERISGGWKFVDGELHGSVRIISDEVKDGVRASLQLRRKNATLAREGSWKLDSSESLVRFANRLAERWPFGKDHWHDMLTWLSNAVLDAHELGEPIEWLNEGDAVEKLPFLINPLAPENQPALMFADSKAGKSYFALWTSAVATEGFPRLPHGIQVMRKCKVLYLDWETDPKVFRYRLRRLTLGLELPQRPRIAYRKMIASLPRELESLRRLQEEHEFDFIVVDSLGRACGGDLYSPDAANRFNSACRELGTTVLVLHHITNDEAKSNGHGSGGGSRPFGSTYFRAYARRLWEIRAANLPNGDKELLLLDAAGNDAAPGSKPMAFRMSFESDGGPVTISELRDVTSHTLRRFEPLDLRIDSCLEDGAETVSDLVRELGEDADVIRTELNEGRRKGKFVVIEAGGGRGKQTRWGRKTG